MIIEQTIEIPASRMITLSIPSEIPAGKARITVIPLEDVSKTTVSLKSLRGSCKGLDTLEAYFQRRRADKELEDHNNSREQENI